MTADARVLSLLAAICAEPSDDDVRLVLADLLQERGDALGALVREDVAHVAAEARRGRPKIRGTPEVRARHAKAIARWRAIVPALDRLAKRPSRFQLVRGLPGHAALSWSEVAAALPLFDEVAPIEHLDLSGGADDGALAALLASPIVPRLRSLSLRDGALSDDHLAEIARAPFTSLRWLDLADNPFGEAGAEALVASTSLPRLTWAGFAGCRVDPTERALTERELGLWDVTRSQGIAVVESGDVADTDQSLFAQDLERRHGPRTWTKVLWRRARERVHRHCYWDLRDVAADDEEASGAVFLGSELVRVHAARARWSRKGRAGPTLAAARVEGCVFDDADLQDLAATRATIADSRFVRARLADARFEHATITRCDFAEADLARVRFDATEVVDTSFRGASLACPDALSRLTNRTGHARFVRCDFRGCDFTHRELVGTSFVDCAFAGDVIALLV
jgi:uncharacterized protein (TIGR02996 family)